jgi:hypothetical protein
MEGSRETGVDLVALDSLHLRRRLFDVLVIHQIRIKPLQSMEGQPPYGRTYKETRADG